MWRDDWESDELKLGMTSTFSIWDTKDKDEMGLRRLCGPFIWWRGFTLDVDSVDVSLKSDEVNEATTSAVWML